MSSSERTAFEREMKNVREQMQSESATQLGFTEEEMIEKKRKAAEPYTAITKDTNRPIKINSAARAKSILQSGMVEKMVQKSTRDIEKKQTKFFYARCLAAIVGFSGAAWIFFEFLYPRYQLRNKRNDMLKRRYEEIFLPSMEKYLAEQERLKAERIARGENIAGPSTEDKAQWEQQQEQPRRRKFYKPSTTG